MTKPKRLSLYKTLGRAIVIFLVYRLLLLERISYILNASVNSLAILLVLSIICFKIIEIVSRIRIIRKKQNTSRIYLYIIKVINKIYYEPLTILGKTLINDKLMQIILHHFYAMMEVAAKGLKSLIAINVVFNLVPLLMATLVLITDILLLNEINNFYKVLWLFLIPLTFQALVAMLNLYATKNKVFLEAEYPITHRRNPNWIYYYNMLDFSTAVKLILANTYYQVSFIIIALVQIVIWSIYIIIIVKAKLMAFLEPWLPLIKLIIILIQIN